MEQQNQDQQATPEEEPKQDHEIGHTVHRQSSPDTTNFLNTVLKNKIDELLSDVEADRHREASITNRAAAEEEHTTRELTNPTAFTRQLSRFTQQLETCKVRTIADGWKMGWVTLILV